LREFASIANAKHELSVQAQFPKLDLL